MLLCPSMLLDVAASQQPRAHDPRPAALTLHAMPWLHRRAGPAKAVDKSETALNNGVQVGCVPVRSLASGGGSVRREQCTLHGNSHPRSVELSSDQPALGDAFVIAESPCRVSGRPRASCFVRYPGRPFDRCSCLCLCAPVGVGVLCSNQTNQNRGSRRAGCSAD